MSQKILPVHSKCPICGKQRVMQYVPFCSARCADVDLNRWLSGVYCVHTNEEPKTVVSEEAKDQ